MRESKMDGAVFVIAVIVILFIFCIGTAILFNKKKKYFLSNVGFFTSAVILYIIILASYDFGKGSIAIDETVMHNDLKFGIIYENLGTVSVEGKFIVLVRERGEQGINSVRAYQLQTKPLSRWFIKTHYVREADGAQLVRYVPYGALANSKVSKLLQEMLKE